MPWESVAITSVIALPALAFTYLALASWFSIRLSEDRINLVVGLSFATAATIGTVLVIDIWVHDAVHYHVDLGTFFAVEHYSFHWDLIADRLSLPFVVFSSVLTGVIGSFSRRYLHREPGYRRFYMLLCMFGAAVNLLVLAANLDLIFFGWEIVGLTSALLIAYYDERKKPVEHGLLAFLTYRVCDIGLLGAAVWLHHTVGTSATVISTPAEQWHGFVVPPHTFDATLIAFLLLWASLGKAAQLPFGGWLPRAMEGPTPSSAIFYGAISVSLGPYLLLRAAPIIHAAPLSAIAIIGIGGLTAIQGTLIGRAQTDIKSSLAYASMAQIGIIYVEIGLGLNLLALIHIVGHAAFRSLQILRSPNRIADYHNLERTIGGPIPETGLHLKKRVPWLVQHWLYRQALDRGYFNVFLKEYVVGGFLFLFKKLDDLDNRWVSFLDSKTTFLNPSTRSGKDQP
ncbi:MAG: NADH/ubiquinone/plastoquinone (complex I) [Myxococcales bacterium]|nr:MAG: NADH/ubiquinone/plastoquinone (complex I) [Myxococcales bacterium]